MKYDKLIFAAVGALVGAAVGYGLGFVISEKRYTTKLNEELSKWHTEEPKPKEEEKAEETEKPEEEQKEDAVDLKTYRDMSSIYSNGETKKGEEINYSGYSEPEKVVESEKDMAPIENESTIYQISEDEYFNDMPGYAKKRMAWYSESHELVDDEDDEPVDINEWLGGIELIVRYLKKNGKIWVRNDDYGADLEVTYIDGTYYHDAW